MEIMLDVSSVLDRLVAIGFPASLEWELKVHTCFMPMQFCVKYEQFKGGDQLCYQIIINLDEQKGQYAPLYYDACLKKQLEMPQNCADAEQIASLNQQMLFVNWNSLVLKGAESTVGDMSELKEVWEINRQLAALERMEEGAQFAHLLKYRYWAQTPFEIYAPVSASLKSQLEVTQRFHFFEGEDGITLEEAYRFLLHRWRERQLQAKRRPKIK